MAAGQHGEKNRLGIHVENSIEVSAYLKCLSLRAGIPCAGLWLSCRLPSRLRRVVSSWKVLGEVCDRTEGGQNLLGITKSGTSAKGEMRLVPKPNGTSGRLEKNIAVNHAWSRDVSGECVTNPLYSFRYNGSAPAVYSSKLSEQVALLFLCTFSFHQS